MLDLQATWEQLLSDLERERDELRVKAQLGKYEARELLGKVEHKLENLRQRAQQILGAAQGSAENIQDSAKLLAAEIRDGFKRVRNLL